MKHFSKILTLLAVAALFAVGCVNEDPAYKDTEPAEPTKETGYLALGDMVLNVIYDETTDTHPEDTEEETQRPASAASHGVTRATTPAPDSFIVEIFDASEVSVLKKSYGELKSEMAEAPLELPVGSYRMDIYSHEEIPTVAWEYPTYGTSYAFSISKGQTETLDKITCTLTNIKVTLECSADLADKLNRETTKATVTLAGTETAADFAIGESRAAYFRSEGQTNRFHFVLSGQFAGEEGKNVSFTKDIDNVKAGQWRKITLVIAYADQGDIKFDIKVENFIQDEEINIDGSLEGAAGTWEYIFEEEPEIDPTAPTITWPGHDLTQTVELTSAMLEQEDYFTFYLSSPNGIQSFIVNISSDNPEFMSSLHSMKIPETFDLCTLQTDHPAYYWLHDIFKFPMGDELRGQTAMPFDISDQMPLLHEFNGTHTFSFTMTDGNGLIAEAQLALFVNKSAEEKPTIAWSGHDLEAWNVLEAGMNISVDIAARSGIRSLLVTIDSEALKPLLEILNLPILLGEFDLCTIDTESPAAADFLSGTVGFKVGEEVRDQPATQFEVGSVFCDILYELHQADLDLPHPYTYQFHITVIDNNGNSTSATLKLTQPDVEYPLPEVE